jgi:hypothetical protein
MTAVSYGAGLGALIGVLPGVFQSLRLHDWTIWQTNTLFIVFACFGAILGAVWGSTSALAQGFRNRHAERSNLDRKKRSNWLSKLWKRERVYNATQKPSSLVIIAVLAVVMIAGLFFLLHTINRELEAPAGGGQPLFRGSPKALP